MNAVARPDPDRPDTNTDAAVTAADGDDPPPAAGSDAGTITDRMHDAEFRVVGEVADFPWIDE